MRKLIKFEYRKLFKQTSFWVCFIITLCVIFLKAVAMNSLNSLYESAGIESHINPFEFTIEFISNSSLVLISGIFIALFVCDDYTCGTIKNIYSKGYTRNKVYLAKYIVSATGTFIMAGAAYIVCFISGLIIFGKIGKIPSNYILIFLAQLFILLGFHTFYFFISNSLAKKGGAIAISIVSPTVLSLFLTIIDYLTWDSKSFFFSKYWLESLLSSVSQFEVISNNLITAFIGSFGYIVFFYFLGFLINRKKQL